MSMSLTPFSHKQLISIGQHLSQTLQDDPILTAHFFSGTAPSTTPGPTTTPGPSRTPWTNPPHHHRNPHTMPVSTHCPQQAINHIPSMTKPCITVPLAVPDAVPNHFITPSLTTPLQTH